MERRKDTGRSWAIGGGLKLSFGSPGVKKF